MADSAASDVMFAVFNLGGGEVVLIITLVLILFGAKNLPDISRRFGVNRKAHEAGESLGGIFGKPAAQALRPDNRTAELYDPGVFRKQSAKRNRIVRRFLQLLRLHWNRACNLTVRCVRALISR
jgi:hypothetical protein